MCNMVKLDRCVRIRISKILHDALFAQFISFELNLDFDRYVGQTFQVRKGFRFIMIYEIRKYCHLIFAFDIKSIFQSYW